jgi:hypothetical protein
MLRDVISVVAEFMVRVLHTLEECKWDSRLCSGFEPIHLSYPPSPFSEVLAEFMTSAPSAIQCF